MNLKNCTLFLLLIFLSACSNNQTEPTRPAEQVVQTLQPDSIVAGAEPLKDEPTLTPIPSPTATLPQPITVVPAENETEATIEPQATAKEEVVEEATPAEPTLEIEAEPEAVEVENLPLVVLAPRPNDPIQTGTVFQLAGQVTPGDTVQVALRSGISELAIGTFIANAEGTWGGDLDIPYSVEGAAILSVTHANEERLIDVVLGRDRENEAEIPGAVIDIDLPAADEAVVSGYMMFLAGSILNPIDDTMTIGLLMDNCTNFVSRQSISITTFEGSWSTWNAQIILPRGLQGEGCIVAYTGEYGAGDWREKRIPVTVVSENDSRASRVKIIDSFAGVLAQGDSIYVSGIATATDTVEFRLLRDGREEIVMVAVPVGDFGFWGIDFSIPVENAVGQMTLEVSVPGAEDRSDSFEFEVR
ncbi:MAG: hypothetical protein AB8G95_10175 [Anaerolineae bacterium]